MFTNDLAITPLFTQTPTTSSDPPLAIQNPEPSYLVPVIIGVACGGALILVIVFVLLAFIFTKRKKRNEEPSELSVSAIRDSKARIASRFSRNIHVELIEEIGKGNFSVVYSGSLKDGTLVCVKMMTSPMTAQMKQEFDIASELIHPNIVAYIGDFKIGEAYYIVTEYMNCGDLAHFIQDDGALISVEQLIEM